MNEETCVTFLGTDAVVPSPGGDTASFVINRRFLVDTGWYAALKMGLYGLDPLAIEYLFLTHAHHDHYLGLPQLLFFRAMRAGRSPLAPLKIVGPDADIACIVELARQFLQTERFPPVETPIEVIPLVAGQSLNDPRFLLETVASVHPVPALCYRFTDLATGATIAFTGDTAYDPGIVQLAMGASLLIHEASYGPNPAPQPDPWGHSGAPDAARVASEANVGQLALVHCPRERQPAALAAAQAIFPNTIWPADGERIVVTPMSR